MDGDRSRRGSDPVPLRIPGRDPGGGHPSAAAPGGGRLRHAAPRIPDPTDGLVRRDCEDQLLRVRSAPPGRLDFAPGPLGWRRMVERAIALGGARADSRHSSSASFTTPAFRRRRPGEYGGRDGRYASRRSTHRGGTSLRRSSRAGRSNSSPSLPHSSSRPGNSQSSRNPPLVFTPPWSSAWCS